MVHKIAVIGSGRRGTALLEIFNENEEINILGVAEINDDKSSNIKEKETFLDIAKKYNLKISLNYLDLIMNTDLDLIADLTRSKKCHEKILVNVKKRNVEIIEGKSAWLFCQLLKKWTRNKNNFETLNDDVLELPFQKKRKKYRYRKPLL